MAVQRRAVIYTRCAPDIQTDQNQLLQLREHAERIGYEIVAELSDRARVGRGRMERPAFKRLTAMITRREFDILLCWRADRLCRSLSDLLAILQALQAKGVDLVLLQQEIDTSQPGEQFLIQSIRVFAELEKSIHREKILAGLEMVRKSGVRLGRPSVASNPEVISEVRALRAAGIPINKISRKLRIGVQTTMKILAA
jgi:DNA invertase Pin-like site-specific DNA recombinase